LWHYSGPPARRPSDAILLYSRIAEVASVVVSREAVLRYDNDDLSGVQNNDEAVLWCTQSQMRMCFLGVITLIIDAGRVPALILGI